MNTDKPLVSVVIACYNHERYVEQAIDSVLAQDYPRVELLVIDDGSTDSSPALLTELSRRHGFSLLLQDNLGLPRTLNRALGMVNGQYFSPLGSDDVLFPDKISRQVEFMERHPDVALLGAQVVDIDESGNPLPRQRRPIGPEPDFNTLMTDFRAGPPAPTTMLRRQRLLQLGGYVEDTGLEDLALWLKLAYAGQRIVVLDQPLAYYRRHARNTHKDYRFMTESIDRILHQYRHEAIYAEARNRFLVSMFLKISRKDRRYALELLRQIDWRYYNLKVLRGLLRCLLPGQQRPEI